MKSFIPGFFFTLFGLLAIIFRSQMARSTVEWNYKVLGIRFSERGYEISALVGGIIFVIIGILTLFQVIKFR